MTLTQPPSNAARTPHPRIAVICHEGDSVNSEFLPRWLAGFADVVAIIVIREGRAPRIRRLRAEDRRVGVWRRFDILAFRLYYRIFLAARSEEHTSELQ